MNIQLKMTTESPDTGHWTLTRSTSEGEEEEEEEEEETGTHVRALDPLNVPLGLNEREKKDRKSAKEALKGANYCCFYEQVRP